MGIRDWLQDLFGREPKRQEEPVAEGFPVAPIIEAPHERGYDRDYRRPGDERWIIRINRKQPRGTPKKLHEYLKVAGVSYRREQVESFIRGSDRHVFIERERDNPHGENAIAVHGTWQADEGQKTAKLGYLPSEVSATLVDVDPIGGRLETMFSPHGSKGAGLRVSVWGPRAKRGADDE